MDPGTGLELELLIPLFSLYVSHFVLNDHDLYYSYLFMIDDYRLQGGFVHGLPYIPFQF